MLHLTASLPSPDILTLKGRDSFTGSEPTCRVRQERSSAPHVDLAGQMLTFGREPVYVRAAELPPQLADDPNLGIEAVEAAPSGVAVIELKPERVQEPYTRRHLSGAGTQPGSVRSATRISPSRRASSDGVRITLTAFVTTPGEQPMPLKNPEFQYPVSLDFRNRSHLAVPA